MHTVYVYPFLVCQVHIFSKNIDFSVKSLWCFGFKNFAARVTRAAELADFVEFNS